MEKFFNTAGPTIAVDHYHIAPLQRVDWQEIEHLIASKRYFVLHAPRQTGKTTTLLAMMQALNASGRYACAYANIEGAQAARGDGTQGIPAACDALVNAINLYLGTPELLQWYGAHKTSLAPQHLLTQVLQQWAATSAKPTVLLLDEVDALVGDTLISLLRQIRAGYAQRPQHFPQAIVLCGVRDYRMVQGDAEVITGGSAFNIKAESLRMGNFTQAETQALWLQHTEATGQSFNPAIFPQLWLVNALGHEATWKNKPARDRSRPSVRISNRIYQEVIPRELTWVTQSYIANQEQSWYVTPDHRLDMAKLLAAFQQFFREHGDIWSEGFDLQRSRGRRRGPFADLQPQPRHPLGRQDLAAPGALWEPADQGVGA